MSPRTATYISPPHLLPSWEATPFLLHTGFAVLDYEPIFSTRTGRTTKQNKNKNKKKKEKKRNRKASCVTNFNLKTTPSTYPDI
jgi:hypothetical protein